MTPAIEVSRLVHRYGTVTAVAGIDLEVSPGECFGLLGPNGAGKTTTMEILEGLLTPTSGQVRILGRTWDEGNGDLRERLGVALQETTLADRLTCLEVIRLFRSFHRRGRDPEEVLAQVGLTDKRDAWVMRLSGGQRQRLALATALVGDPDILFLDEPTTGLDPTARRDLWQVVEDALRRGHTCVLTTHSMEEAERLCQRVAILDHGRVIAQGTPAELVATLGASEVVELATDPPLPPAVFAVVPGVHQALPGPRGARLTVDRSSEVLPELIRHAERQGAALASLDIHRATLDDVFLRLTGRSLEADG
ncbi:MAG TPA: ABC transporter ATP-binding protein [Myxococcota bacterium]|nr:ABC transporter ATP-binding protein [Myxococcota bacterium]HQK50159.1 ABC transporter ATP-binding protein [Myxococcota bacterium]